MENPMPLDKWCEINEAWNLNRRNLRGYFSLEDEIEYMFKYSPRWDGRPEVMEYLERTGTFLRYPNGDGRYYIEELKNFLTVNGEKALIPFFGCRCLIIFLKGRFQHIDISGTCPAHLHVRQCRCPLCWQMATVHNPNDRYLNESPYERIIKRLQEYHFLPLINCIHCNKEFYPQEREVIGHFGYYKFWCYTCHEHIPRTSSEKAEDRIWVCCSEKCQLKINLTIEKRSKQWQKIRNMQKALKKTRVFLRNPHGPSESPQRESKPTATSPT